MRTILVAAAIGLVVSLMGGPPAASQDSAGWTDLFGQDLKDWSRTGTGKNPWTRTTQRTLVCARGASDQYLPERLFGDGTLKFEYRFLPTGEKTGYKGALIVRRTQDGRGVRLDLGDDCGALSATVGGSSDRAKTIEDRPAAKVAKAAGEWNTVEVVCDGRGVSVQVNGKAASSLAQTDLETGLIAFSAEGSEIEFRQVFWKEGK